MVKLRHDPANKFLTIARMKFFPDVFPHNFADIGAERKWVKGVDEIFFAAFVGLVAGCVYRNP